MSKNEDMSNLAMSTKKKLIDIPEDVFRALSIKAAAQGTNLKRYIELLLVQDAESPADAGAQPVPIRSNPVTGD